MYINKIKLAIIGSRDFNDYFLLKKSILENYDITKIEYIVSGGAKGADSLGERFAREFKIKTIIHYPDWNTYGRKAGFLRNAYIIRDATDIIAFWDGFSRETEHSLDLAEKHKKKIKVVRFDYFKSK